MNAGIARPKYRRLVELGRGGMATVHLTALSGPVGFQKLVVVKEMRPDLAQQDEFRRMFFEEARVAAQLNHPNVVQTFEVVEDPPGVYSIVMEFLDGQPLSRVLQRSNDASEMLHHTLFILSQALGALHYLHELRNFQGASLGLVHRDVSPHNIFVTYDGDVKLLDFGIMKTAASSVHTEVGTLKGKVAYMAPEQATGREVDRRTDVFAAGVVLWEALTRKRIWEKLNNISIIGRLTAGEIPPIRTALVDVAPALEAICMRALAPDPAARYQTALAMQREIDAFAATLPLRSDREGIGQRVSAHFAADRRLLRKAVDDVLTGNARSGERLAAPASIPSAGLPTIVGPDVAVIAGSSSVVGTTTDRHVSGTSPRPARGSSLAIVGGIAAAVFVVLAVVASLVFLRPRPSPIPALAAPPSATQAGGPSVVPRSTPSAAPSAEGSSASATEDAADASGVVPVGSTKKVPTGKPGPRGTPAHPSSTEDPNDVGF